MNQVQNELAHYGVLGMKWGKRNRGMNDIGREAVEKQRKG